jgi:hypothetical protein
MGLDIDVDLTGRVVSAGHDPRRGHAICRVGRFTVRGTTVLSR